MVEIYLGSKLCFVLHGIPAVLSRYHSSPSTAHHLVQCPRPARCLFAKPPERDGRHPACTHSGARSGAHARKPVGRRCPSAFTSLRETRHVPQPFRVRGGRRPSAVPGPRRRPPPRHRSSVFGTAPRPAREAQTAPCSGDPRAHTCSIGHGAVHTEGPASVAAVTA